MSSKNMLVTLHIRKWSGKKTDRKASKTVRKSHNCTRQSGRYVKNLIDPRSPELKAVTKVASAARNYVHENTLPWQIRGDRLLPVARYFDFVRGFKQYEKDFESAVDDFIGKYHERIDEARQALGDLFDGSDYPTELGLKRKFEIFFEVRAVEESDKLVVDLPEEELDKLRNNIKRQVSEKYANAKKSLVDKAYAMLRLIVKNITEDVKFHQSMLDNVTTHSDFIEDCNFDDDARLEILAEDMKDLIKEDAPLIKKNDKLKRRLLVDTKSLIHKMDKIFV